MELGVRMPASDEMEAASMIFVNLPLLCRPIGTIAEPAASIGEPRTCRSHNFDLSRSQAGEKQSTCLAVPETDLPVTIEVIKDVIGKD